jgi:hypothetical protein
MLAGFDADQHRQAYADAIRVDDGDPAGDYACGFKLLDALPAWRWRKSNAFRHLRDR